LTEHSEVLGHFEVRPIVGSVEKAGMFLNKNFSQRKGKRTLPPSTKELHGKFFVISHLSASTRSECRQTGKTSYSPRSRILIMTRLNMIEALI